MLRKLSRTNVNFLLDATLLLLFVALCICSAILEFVFPAGTRAEGWRLWSRTYNEWSRIRFSILSLMTIAVLLHVMLHWNWVCGVIESRLRDKSHRKGARDDPRHTLWGVSLLIVIFNVAGLIIGLAILTIQSP